MPKRFQTEIDAKNEQNPIPSYLSDIDLNKFMGPVKDKVEQILGFDPQLKFTLERGRHNRGWYITVESKELVSDSGIFKTIFCSVKLEEFGGVADEKHIYLTISLRWSHSNGGSNGADLIRCSYLTSDERWEFKRG